MRDKNIFDENGFCYFGRRYIRATFKIDGRVRNENRKIACYRRSAENVRPHGIKILNILTGAGRRDVGLNNHCWTLKGVSMAYWKTKKLKSSPRVKNKEKIADENS